VRTLRELAKRGAPLVMLLDRAPDPRVPSIRIDDAGGAYLATQHLLRLGHRRIAHISVNGGRIDRDDGSPQFKRFSGFRRALAEADVAVDPALVIQGPGLMAGGQATARALLARFADRREWPSAIFVYNDLAAVGVLRALYEAGVLVPDDMAIIGFHGLELGRYTTPALSSVGHARAELGDMAARLLLEAIEHPRQMPEAGETVLPVELVVRESCGAARASSLAGAAG
jgi:LacI family transcriptional regulator